MLEMYAGIDDTDSREGMCTTYVGMMLILKLQEMGFDIISYPSLVRLNPNIPWKTRGNGAIAVRFGRGYGEKFQVGEWRGEKIYSWRRGKNAELRYEEMKDIVNYLSDFFMLDDENTNPGVVFAHKKVIENIYWQGVRNILTVDFVEQILQDMGAIYFKFKNGRGIIGAAAAIAWRKRKKTYELLTYLPKEKWKEERYIDKRSVIEMDRKTRYTFDNYDYENDYMAIKPNARTPVLYGIRGLEPGELIVAKDIVRSDHYEGWLIYETNQATDDHIVRKKIRDIKRYESVLIRGTVVKKPKKIEGGHVVFTLQDSTGKIDCAAYEPTKGFRDVVSKLYPGDVIEVYGSVGKYPGTVNIEKLQLIKVKGIWVKVENPRCPICGRKMESIGRGKGYRCRKCGIKLPERAAKYKKIERLKPGFYEVPVIARRHLSKPIKLIQSTIVAAPPLPLIQETPPGEYGDSR